MKKEMSSGTENQPYLPHDICCCASTIPTSDIVPKTSSGTTSAKPCGTSYEIICAAERRPPISENLLFEDQPPMIRP